MDIADRVIVMQEGLIVESGTSTQVLNKPKHKYTKSLIAAIPRLKPRKTRKRSKEVVVETSALHKSFGGGRSFLGFGRRARNVDAVVDVNIELRKGETLGVVGESGSGKSVTAKALMHLNAQNTVYGSASRITLQAEQLVGNDTNHILAMRCMPHPEICS